MRMLLLLTLLAVATFHSEAGHEKHQSSKIDLKTNSTGLYGCWLYGSKTDTTFSSKVSESENWIKVSNVDTLKACQDMWTNSGGHSGFGAYILTTNNTEPVGSTNRNNEKPTGCGNCGGEPDWCDMSKCTIS